MRLPDELMQVPFVSGGRTMAGADCYGWVRLVLFSVFGASGVPEYAMVYDATAKTQVSHIIGRLIGEWRPVAAGEERPGDVVILRIGPYPCHCGVVLEPGMVGHLEPLRDARQSMPVAESYWRGRWEQRVVGFVRWKNAQP